MMYTCPLPIYLKVVMLLLLCLPSKAMAEAGSLSSLAPQNPAIADAGELVEDENAAVALGQMVSSYISGRQERREEQRMLVPILQQDLDALYAFAIDNRATEAALTAKLLLGTFLGEEVRVIDSSAGIPIIEDIVINYEHTWQASVAKGLLISAELWTAENLEGQNAALVALRSHLHAALPLARLLDSSTKADVEAARSLLARMTDGILEAHYLSILGSLSEKLGDNDKAREYYEQMAAQYAGTELELSAIRDLKSLDRRLAENREVSDTLPRFEKDTTQFKGSSTDRSSASSPSVPAMPRNPDLLVEPRRGSPASVSDNAPSEPHRTREHLEEESVAAPRKGIWLLVVAALAAGIVCLIVLRMTR